MMKGKRIFKKPSGRNGVNFIFYPIAFFLAGVLICYFSFASILTEFDKTLNIFLYMDPPTFSDIKENLMANAKENGEIKLPEENQLFAKIRIESADIDANVFYGDNATVLLKGVGCSREAYIPGFKHTVLMCAHNNTYFHTLGKVKVGDEIHITTNYGHYVYEVTGSRIANENDQTAYDLYKNEENLILYTCYPFDELRLTPQRYFVYAKYVSGPQKNDIVYNS